MQLRSPSLAPLLAAVLLALPAALGAQTLRGSRATVDRTYRQAVKSDVPFYKSGRGVREAAAEGDLVRLPGNADYRTVGTAFPYTLPSTRLFVTRLARQYRQECGEKLVVTSATRPKSYRVPHSIDLSVHPAGMAVDLRRPTRRACVAWLRETLLSIEAAGAIDGTEEHHPPHFHVAVFPGPYRRYVARRGGEPSRARAEKPASRSASAAARTTSRPAAPSRTASASAGRAYRVRSGDTLWTIARRSGISVDRLREANGLGARATLQPGQKLLIPAR
jgi:hypothetical protein